MAGLIKLMFSKINVAQGGRSSERSIAAATLASGRTTAPQSLQSFCNQFQRRQLILSRGDGFVTLLAYEPNFAIMKPFETGLVSGMDDHRVRQ